MSILVPRSMFEEASPLWRHSLYGINCYQWAIGYKTPMVVVTSVPKQDHLRTLSYVYAFPGKSFEKTQHPELMMSKTRAEIFAEGCLEEGMKRIEKDAHLSKEWRKIAYYFSYARNDAHFASENDDGDIEEKSPFCETECYEGIPDILRGDYSLQAVFAAKASIKPRELSFRAKTIAIKERKWSGNINLMRQSDKLPLGKFPLTIDTKLKTALYKNQLIPMPYWDDRLAAGSPAGMR